MTPAAPSKTYGTADPVLTGTLTGFLTGDGVTAAYSRVAGETVLGGPYTISAMLSPATVLSNYTITYNTASFTITAKTASVTPNPVSKILGAPDPSPLTTGTLSGFLAADGVTATYSRTAGETVASSPYTISATLSPAGMLGNYTITYNTASFKITYAMTGLCYGEAGHQILQPINVDGTSVFKLGSTVPTKFRVCDANGVPVGPTTATPNVVVSYRIVGLASGTITDVDEAIDSTTPDTAFRWSSTDQLWIFNTKTGANTNLNQKNVSYWLQITLADGTIIGSIPTGPYSGKQGHQIGLK